MFTSAFVTTGSHPSHSWPLRKRANVPPGWRLGASSCSRNELSDRWCLPCAGWIWNISGIWKGNPGKPNPKWPFFAHRIHGAAIYGNIYHQYTPNVSIYTIHGSYGLGKINENHGIYLRSTLCLCENRLSGNDFWPHHKKRVVKPNMKEQVGQRADGVQVIIRKWWKCKEQQLGSTTNHNNCNEDIVVDWCFLIEIRKFYIKGISVFFPARHERLEHHTHVVCQKKCSKQIVENQGCPVNQPKMRCAWFNGKWRAMCQHDINTSTIYNQVLPFKGPSCFSPLYSEHLYIYIIHLINTQLQ